MPEINNVIKWAKYKVGALPNFMQLPNPLKAYEFDQLAGKAGFKKGERVLDLGCGRGLQAQLIAGMGPSVVGIDPGKKYIQNAKRDLQWSRVRDRVEFREDILSDGMFPDSSFDHVVSFCVMEHIPNLDAVLKTVHRLLKTGGKIHTTLDSLQNIGDPKLKETHRTMFKVVQYFTLENVDKVFGAAGFKVLEKRYILRGALAVKELRHEIESGEGSWPEEKRAEGFEALSEEEGKLKDTDPGIMILCRVQKI